MEVEINALIGKGIINDRWSNLKCFFNSNYEITCVLILYLNLKESCIKLIRQGEFLQLINDTNIPTISVMAEIDDSTALPFDHRSNSTRLTIYY